MLIYSATKNANRQEKLQLSITKKKVDNLFELKPSMWYKEIKQICGKSPGGVEIFVQILMMKQLLTIVIWPE